jgi:hypothetical protein
MAEQLLLSDRETTLAPSAPAQSAPSEIPRAQRRPWSGNTFVHLTVLVAAAIIVVLFATQWDRWVGLAVRQVTDDAYVRGDITPLAAKVEAQMEGGIGFGLGAVLYGAITLKDGQVEQSNFDGYQVLRIDDMPKVEVHIVPSTEAPTGVGEPGVAPIGPAVANAAFAATGKRYRVLPFSAFELHGNGDHQSNAVRPEIFDHGLVRHSQTFH